MLPGTAVAVRNQYGFFIQSDLNLYYWTYYTVEGIVAEEGSSVVSHGTPVRPNIFTAEKMVQEFPETDFSEFQLFNTVMGGLVIWYDAISFVSDCESYAYNNSIPAPNFDFRFSKFYLPPNDYHLSAGCDEVTGALYVSPDSSMYLNVRD